MSLLFLATIFFYSGPTWPGPTLSEATLILNAGETQLRAANSNNIDDNLTMIYSRELRAAELKLKKGLVWEEKKKAISKTMSSANTTLRERLVYRGEVSPSTLSLAQGVYNELMTNKVSNFGANPKYDKNGDIGFCFGRAAFVHYLLIKKKVTPEQILKIIAMGTTKYQDQIWEFHMATMVRGDQGPWLVIDALFERVLTVDEWMLKVSELDLKYPYAYTRFYTTDPRKFQPAYGKYETKYFEIPELRNFFTDLFSSVN